MNDNTVARRSLRAEVLERKKLGLGIPSGPDEIARIPVNNLESLLENVPSLIVEFEAMNAKTDATSKTCAR